MLVRQFLVVWLQHAAPGREGLLIPVISVAGGLTTFALTYVAGHAGVFSFYSASFWVKLAVAAVLTLGSRRVGPRLAVVCLIALQCAVQGPDAYTGIGLVQLASDRGITEVGTLLSLHALIARPLNSVAPVLGSRFAGEGEWIAFLTGWTAVTASVQMLLWRYVWVPAESPRPRPWPGPLPRDAITSTRQCVDVAVAEPGGPHG